MLISAEMQPSSPTQVAAERAIERKPNVTLHRLPYPYKSMLAICSDLDETPNRNVYWEIARFLNTTQSTSMGPGAGLEVGNTIYFDMPADQFAYWNTDDAGRDMVRTLIRSGHIDCLHSYGDLATTRAHAGRALDELVKHNCKLEVWVDHSKAVTNFGPDIMRGQGDVPGAPAYHADLTCDFGIRYVSRGRVTSVIGQDVPSSLGGIFSARHPLASAKTLAKEAAKQLLARRGNQKYQMHAANRVTRMDVLRDGRPVCEFLRGDAYWGGVGNAADAQGLAEVLTAPFLDRLVHRTGFCVLYTHLGKSGCRESPLPLRTRQALHLLAAYVRDKKVCVTTTRRLLQYLTVRDSLRFVASNEDGRVVIRVCAVNSRREHPRPPTPHEMQGITFQVNTQDTVEVRLADESILESVQEPIGAQSLVTIPWKRLTFPSI